MNATGVHVGAHAVKVQVTRYASSLVLLPMPAVCHCLLSFGAPLFSIS